MNFWCSNPLLRACVRSSRLLCVGVLLLGAARGDAALPTPYRPALKIDIQRYTVRGDSAEELTTAMRALGPVDERGKRRFARVNWEVWWDFPSVNGRLDFERAYTSYKLALIIPEWTASPAAEPGLAQSWAEYSNRLIAHELQHVKHLEMHIDRIAPAIAEAARKNPGLTRAQANQIGHSILARIRKLDREYDKKTDHGKTEGITLE